MEVIANKPFLKNISCILFVVCLLVLNVEALEVGYCNGSGDSYSIKAVSCVPSYDDKTGTFSMNTTVNLTTPLVAAELAVEYVYYNSQDETEGFKLDPFCSETKSCPMLLTDTLEGNVSLQLTDNFAVFPQIHQIPKFVWMQISQPLISVYLCYIFNGTTGF